METRQSSVMEVPTSAPARSGIPRLGDQLKDARERRGIVLDDVAQTTKIRKDYLLALERHEWSALPGDVFTQGYLRSYAECLGLDPAYMLKVYARERRISEAGSAPANGGVEDESARTLLSKLAGTQTGDSRAFAAGIRWTALGLTVSFIGVGVIWGAVHLARAYRHSSRETQLASRTSTRAETTSDRPAPLAHAADAVAGAARGAASGEAARPGSSLPHEDDSSPPATGATASETAVGAAAAGTNEVSGLPAESPVGLHARSDSGSRPGSTTGSAATSATAMEPPSPPDPRAARSTDARETSPVTVRATGPGVSPDQLGSVGRTAGAEHREGSSDARIKVPEFGVGSKVVGHRLVGQSERFEEGSVAWFWTRLVGARRGERVQHVWFHDGRQVAVAVLRVGASQWRTQSRKPLTAGSIGDWVVEARDAEGRVLASSGFTCVPHE